MDNLEIVRILEEYLNLTSVRRYRTSSLCIPCGADIDEKHYEDCPYLKSYLEVRACIKFLAAKQD